METRHDVIVVGGGLVGASCALALGRAGLDTVLVEGQAPCGVPPGEAGWDSRIYAISPGSVRFLEALGVWARLPAERLQAVSAMHIRGDDGRSFLHFSAYEAGVAALAVIVESRELSRALWQALPECPQVVCHCPARPSRLALEADWARLFLDDGTVLAAKLIVGADGARSWVRQQAGLRFRDKDYRQMGVVANFACEKPHGGIARQWFRSDGILAWLPLPGNHLSMVWSTDTAHAAKLLALPPGELAVRVTEVSDAVGTLTCITPAAAFSLHLIQVDTVVAPRLALIGDAAHQVHPLAGQGVNLGFGDAEVLARELSRRGVRDCGEFALLRRYERARKEDVLAMQFVTDALKELFAHPHPMVGVLRNLGLSATQRAGFLKQALVRHALGTT